MKYWEIVADKPVFRWLRNDRIRRLKLEALLSAMRDQQQNKT